MTTTNDEREALLAAAKAEYLTPLLAELDAAIIALGGKPDSPAWDDWDIADLLRMGDAARHVKKAYGATLTVKAKATRKGGRPKALDERAEAEVRERLRRGVAAPKVADLAGVSLSTVKRLIRDFEF